MRRALVTVSTLAALAAPGPGQDGTPDWRALRTVADVCTAWPARVEALLDALDLERPELAPVAAARQRADLAAAATALLAYYRDGTTAAWLRTTPPARGTARDADGDRLLDDRFTFAGLEARVPRVADGRLDWDWLGPEHDREFGWSLNRHFLVDDLHTAWQRTGNPVYLSALDAALRDWLTSSPYPGKRSATPRWRGLEVHFRAKFWSALFFALQPLDPDDPDGFRAATRLLLLTALPEHADYLRRFHAAGGNWVTMEMTGLATLAAAFPEFRDADAWWAAARDSLTREIDTQVYPDGAQKELTASYHLVALRNFEQMVTLARVTDRALDPAFLGALERMWDYAARIVEPDIATPQNNDSDHRPIGDELLAAAKRYARPDWTFVATHGASGTAPAGPASAVFPWAGHLVMRDGYAADADWALFDFGPWGLGHQHQDKLHLSVTVHGRRLLVDSGRFAYSGTLAERFRNAYARHARGHNVLLLDGRGQAPGPKTVDEPVAAEHYGLTPQLDWARGTHAAFERLEGAAAHTRIVVKVHDGPWIVVDRVVGDRPRHVDALWHFHPDRDVRIDGDEVVTAQRTPGNLRVSPVGAKWTVRIDRGVSEPTLQGWHSDSYHEARPAPCAVFETDVDGDAVFAWILTPGDAPPPPPAGDVARDSDAVVVTWAEGRSLRVPLERGAPTLKGR